MRAPSMVGAVRAASIVFDGVVPPSHGLVVLAYHQVGAPGAGTVNLPISMFDEQMAQLAAGRKADVATLDAAVAAATAQRGRTISADSSAGASARDLVAITFDDGTADFVDHALPILVRHGVPATLYLATGAVEEGRSFWDDGTVLSWSALREALSTGLVTIGSHTHSHVLLDRVDPATAADELDRSIDLIGERLGVEARHFAYPKALAPSPSSDRAVRARFVSAARAGGRVNPLGRTDPYALARTPIVVRDGVRDFTRKARGGLRLEGLVRERLDGRRYRGRAS